MIALLMIPYMLFVWLSDLIQSFFDGMRGE